MLWTSFDFQKSFLEEALLPRVYWFGLLRDEGCCEGKAGADFPDISEFILFTR